MITPRRHRLSVFRSLKHISAQIIDDQKGITLVSFSDLQLDKAKISPKEAALKVGESLAKLAKGKKITKVVFDRGVYKYHGRITALAEGARKGGLEF